MKTGMNKFVVTYALGSSACAAMIGCDIGARSQDVSTTCETSAFCDDFEASEVGAKPGGPWTTNEISGTITVDDARAFSGKRSVKYATTGASAYQSVLMAHPGVAALRGTSSIVYGRMMYWLDTAPVDDVHWTFIAGEGLVPGQTYRATLRYGGQHPITNSGSFVGSQLMANYETPDSHNSPPMGPATDCWHHADQKVVPTGKWTCAAWSFDTAKDEMRFWLDGGEIADLHVVGQGQGCVDQPADYVWDAPDVNKIFVGWESYQTDAPRNLWIDDVAIDTKPIACP